jgi:hypothetical protein
MHSVASRHAMLSIGANDLNVLGVYEHYSATWTGDMQ